MWRIRSWLTGCSYLRAGGALSLFVCGIAIAVLALTASKSAAVKGRVMTRSVAGATTVPETLPADMPLTLTVVLNRADQQAFESFLHGVQNPGSPSYRHYLSPREQAERFGPTASSFNTVNDWLRQQGFKNIEGSANRLTLTVSGTRAMAEKTFGVRIDKYRLGNRTFYANDRDPVLPDAISSDVAAVIGLSDRAKPQAGYEVQVRTNCESIASVAADQDPIYRACLLGRLQRHWGICDLLYREKRQKYAERCLELKGVEPESAGNGPPFLTVIVASNAETGGPRQVSPLGDELNESVDRQAAVTVPWAKVTGANQTIGLLEFDSFNVSDIRDYLALTGHSAAELNRLSQIHVNGGATVGPEEAEVLMDVIAAMSNAPGANVVVYDAPFTTIRTSFQTLFNRMIGDGVTVISNSWVYCEDQSTLADAQSLDSILASAAAAGITVLNSTGDFGSTCVNGSSNTASIPASCPHGTAVGGTSLTVGPAVTYGSEIFWNGVNDSPPTGQGGFGVSRFFSRPAYQNGFTTSTTRSIPDVAVNADPMKGIEICQADAGGCPTGANYGGTSLAAPVWAAFVALLNQAQGQNLGEINPLLYPLGNTGAFHSATSIGSDFQHAGLGSPNLNLIHRALTGKTPGAASATVSEIAADPHGALADGIAKAFVVVRLRDAEGHTIGGKTVTLTGNPGSHATVNPASGGSDAATGAVIFSVKDATPEIVTFTASDTTDGIVLQKSVDVAFVARPASAGGISASPTSVNANGSDTTTITVTLQDAKGNPSSDKLVDLIQGNGSSIISASNAITDATGKAHFTASNNAAQTIIYSAVDVTDRNAPVPGSATVNFVNASGFCAGTNSFKFGTAAPGYAVTSFASSFPIDCFSGIGPIGVAFDGQNNLLVGNTANSVLYSFTPQGGVAGPATRIGQITPANGPVAGLAFGRDGRLYAGVGSQVVEVNPATAAVIRVVANLSDNALDLHVDPLSGDLFVSIYGGIYRITNFTNGPVTVTPYMQGGFTDGFVFAPDGTIYVKAATDGIYRGTGTNTPNPGTATQIAFVTGGADGIALEQNPANPSKPFLYVNRNDGVITRIDLNAAPANVFNCNDAGAPCTNIYTGGSRGDFVTVGNDGCLYATQSERVIKITKADGTCGLTPVSQAPQLVLTPMTTTPSPAQGKAVTFTASLKNVATKVDVPVTLFITGANPIARLVRTDANGNANITYSGVFAGADEVFAVADLGGSELFSNTATVTWTSGKHSTFLTLNQSPGTGAPDKATKLKASLVDVSASPPVPIANAAVNFNLAGQFCSGATDANGQVVCSVTPTAAPGRYEITATFGGTTQFLESSARKGFDLLVQPPHQLLNISTRMRVLAGDRSLIGGFIITGSESKKVIIRGMGPSLSAFGLHDVLNDPVLELHPANGPTVTNDNWTDSQRAEIEASGLAPGNGRESAIIATLPPGNHTALLSGKGGSIGGGLVEVYDLSQPANAKLANISTRGFVDKDDNIMIAGFIAGPETGTLVQVLVRAIGPTLTTVGVPDALQNPTLELHDSNGGTIAINDDWKDTQQSDIEQTGIPPSDNREAAILSPLAPGNYTAILRGKNNTTGNALVEVYNLP
jgi:hypothetical protein